MTEESPLDGPPQDELAHAFRLPASIEADPEMVELHGEIVRRLRREASGISMNTVQQLLLERIATQYVATKVREQAGTLSLRDMKEQNTVWLSMTQEFNRLLMASEDKLRDALMAEMQEIVIGSLDLVADKETRQTLRRHLAEQFASIDQ